MFHFSRYFQKGVDWNTNIIRYLLNADEGNIRCDKRSKMIDVRTIFFKTFVFMYAVIYLKSILYQITNLHKMTLSRSLVPKHRRPKGYYDRHHECCSLLVIPNLSFGQQKHKKPNRRCCCCWCKVELTGQSVSISCYDVFCYSPACSALPGLATHLVFSSFLNEYIGLGVSKSL